MAIELKNVARPEQQETLPKTTHSATSRKKKYTLRVTYTKQLSLEDIFSEDELAYIVPKNPTPAQVEEAMDKGFRFEVTSSGYLLPEADWPYVAEEWLSEAVLYQPSDVVLEVTE